MKLKCDEPPGATSKRLKLKYDEPLSSFAFVYNLCRYIPEVLTQMPRLNNLEMGGNGLMALDDTVVGTDG